MNKQFGAILSEGISSIAHRWHKTKSAVYREITQHLRDAGFSLADSTVEGWCRGFVPKEPEIIARIVSYCVQRGRIDRQWAESLLLHAHYPERTALLKKLFPLSNDEEEDALSAKHESLSYVNDPAITLQTSLDHHLVGRHHLLATLKQRLIDQENQGLMALIGLPGVGKTTLAIELAQSDEIHQAFRDGILYVNLGPQPDIGHHLERWAKLLGLITDDMHSAHRQEYTEAIHTSIGKRRMLLVIEDAWTVDAALTFQLGGPYCAHLLTTRFSDIALHFAGQGVVKVTELDEQESMHLLARFIPQVVKDAPEQLRALIRAVGGLPLALTLLGRYLQVHAFHQQPRRLQQALLTLQQATERLRLEYSQGPRETSRHTSPSLMASIGTSYHALSPDAQQALGALCIFPVKPNTFSEEAAIVVSAEPPTLLDELLDTGLLESVGGGRYTMHQTIADYASLQHQGHQAEKRLVDFFVNFVQTHQNEYSLLDQEATNIMYALSLAATEQLWPDLIQGVQAFFQFLLLRGWYETATTYCQQELEAAQLLNDQEGICLAYMHVGTLSIERGAYDQAEISAREGLDLARHIQHPLYICTLLQVQGTIAMKKGDSAQTERSAQEGLALARRLNNGHLAALHLLLLGTAKSIQGEYRQGEALFLEGLDIARQIHDTRAMSGLLSSLGSFAGMRADYAQAERYFQEGLTIARSIRDIERVTAFLKGLGILAGIRFEYVQAEKYFQEALPLAEATGLREHIASLYTNLSVVARYRGHGLEAEAYALKGLAIARDIGHKIGICDLLTGLGVLHTQLHQFQTASQYLEEAITLAVELGHPYHRCKALYAFSQVLINQEEWEKAEVCLQDITTLLKDGFNTELKCEALNGWGEYYVRRREADSASASFRKALELARTIDAKEPIAGSLFGLARAALLKGNLAQACIYGEESAQMFSTINAFSAKEVQHWLTEVAGSSKNASISFHNW